MDLVNLKTETNISSVSAVAEFRNVDDIGK